jgi:hypothetical protein
MRGITDPLPVRARCAVLTYPLQVSYEHDMKTFHVYAIINSVTQDAYVGCTSHITHRSWQHMDQLRNRTHPSPALQTAWDEHGPASFQFTVLLVLEGVKPSKARQVELVWIEKFGTYNEVGANGGKAVWSDALRQNMSEHTKRRWADPELRKPLLKGLEQGNGFVKGMKPNRSRKGDAQHAAHMREVWADPERRIKLEARRAARWNDPEARARQAEKMRAYHAARRAGLD